MAAVWYLGTANSRTITSSQWAAVGAPGATATWDTSNGWSLPRSSFTPAQLSVLDADGGFETNAVDGPRPNQPAVIEDLYDTSPRELGYAETTAPYSNTVANLDLGAASAKIPGLYLANIMGTGRPVEVKAYFPKMSRTVASTLRIAIVMNNALILNCNDTQLAANAGEGMQVEARPVLAKGQMATFDARMCGDVAGTTNMTVAAGSHVAFLSVNQK